MSEHAFSEIIVQRFIERRVAFGKSRNNVRFNAIPTLYQLDYWLRFKPSDIAVCCWRISAPIRSRKLDWPWNNLVASFHKRHLSAGSATSGLWIVAAKFLPRTIDVVEFFTNENILQMLPLLPSSAIFFNGVHLRRVYRRHWSHSLPWAYFGESFTCQCLRFGFLWLVIPMFRRSVSSWMPHTNTRAAPTVFCFPFINICLPASTSFPPPLPASTFHSKTDSLPLSFVDWGDSISTTRRHTKYRRRRDAGRTRMNEWHSLPCLVTPSRTEFLKRQGGAGYAHKNEL